MRSFLLFLLLLILLFFLYCFFVRKGGCCIGRVESHDTITTKHWISWNLLFTPTSVGTSAQVIQDFEDTLNKYVKGINPDASLSFEFHYCPCDSLLTNIDATLVYGSGNSVPPPPTKPNPGPSGDYTLAKNLDTYMAERSDSAINVLDSVNIKNRDAAVLIAGTTGTIFDKTLAVIDTGLDTFLYKKIYPNTIWNGNILWQDPAKPTLFDVVLGEPNNTLIDDNEVRHGTAATYIALSQMQLKKMQNGQMPKIMSIRAFDKGEKGSIYTVSCALSYAIQHKADYINASWGYYGAQDPVLRRYIKIADRASIRVIAAAGNSPIIHETAKICKKLDNDLNDLDRLDIKDSLFYPACFASTIDNVVSVTQLSPDAPAVFPNAVPCYYQNYSPKYITVGALDKNPRNDVCCTFSIPFMSRAIEGSSFATPAATGILMSQVTSKSQNIKLYITTHFKPTPVVGITAPTIFTNEGDFIQYIQK
ncbi:MAG TPA: S8 family serine peptidase [Puia sp.]|jgi:hypothetical protein|nr:S8 family serine peptidase [Puia sp.]